MTVGAPPGTAEGLSWQAISAQERQQHTLVVSTFVMFTLAGGPVGAGGAAGLGGAAGAWGC